MPRTAFSHPIPTNALHKYYADVGGHADAYSASLDFASLDFARDRRDERGGGGVTLAEFVTAFYTSPLFRLERWVLAVVLGMRSSDAEARGVAVGASDRFAAWTVESRTFDQLVMVDYQGRTRSWFMVERLEGQKDGPSTRSGRTEIGSRVWFGTAIRAGRGGRVPLAFRALMPFHRLYSRALLFAAVRRLARRIPSGSGPM